MGHKEVTIFSGILRKLVTGNTPESVGDGFKSPEDQVLPRLYKLTKHLKTVRLQPIDYGIGPQAKIVPGTSQIFPLKYL